MKIQTGEPGQVSKDPQAFTTVNLSGEKDNLPLDYCFGFCYWKAVK